MTDPKSLTTSPSTLTTSERCARLLLAAWNTADLAGLEAALLQAAAADQAGLSPCEEERMELVREIAAGIQTWLRGVRMSQPANLNVHLDLLRHLARTEGASSKKSPANEDDLDGSIRITEGPRLEMLVSGPH